MSASPQRSLRGRRDVFVFIAVLGGVCMLGAVATDLFQPGLPAVGADLRAGTGLVQLTVTATLFGMAVGQLAVGPLSDSIGRRRPLLAGLACVGSRTRAGEAPAARETRALSRAVWRRAPPAG